MIRDELIRDMLGELATLQRMTDKMLKLDEELYEELYKVVDDVESVLLYADD